MNLLLHLKEQGHPLIIVNWAHVSHAIAVGDGTRLSLDQRQDDYGCDFLLVTESLNVIRQILSAGRQAVVRWREEGTV